MPKRERMPFYYREPMLTRLSWFLGGCIVGWVSTLVALHALWF